MMMIMKMFLPSLRWGLGCGRLEEHDIVHAYTSFYTWKDQQIYHYTHIHTHTVKIDIVAFSIHVYSMVVLAYMDQFFWGCGKY